jgi:hypothetical protein
LTSNAPRPTSTSGRGNRPGNPTPPSSEPGLDREPSPPPPSTRAAASWRSTDHPHAHSPPADPTAPAAVASGAQPRLVTLRITPGGRSGTCNARSGTCNARCTPVLFRCMRRRPGSGRQRPRSVVCRTCGRPVPVLPVGRIPLYCDVTCRTSAHRGSFSGPEVTARSLEGGTLHA